MPQPLPNGKSVSRGPNKVLEKPELAAAIGNICANWALIEDDILLLYGLLMGTYAPAAPESAPPTHPVAYQIFDTLNALNPRLDLLAKLCQWRAPDKATELRENLVPCIKKRFAERSVVAHTAWGTCKDYPDALIDSPIFGRMKRYEKRDFDNISARILDLHRDLGAFINPIYERFRKKIPPDPPQSS